MLPGAATVPGAGELEQWLRSRVDSAGEDVARRWEPWTADRFVVVSRTVTGGSEAQWAVDVKSRTVVPDDGEDEDVAWCLLASPETWQAVRAGQDNLLAAMRRSDMRYSAADEGSPVLAQTRVAMVADLLGLSTWDAGVAPGAAVPAATTAVS